LEGKIFLSFSPQGTVEKRAQVMEARWCGGSCSATAVTSQTTLRRRASQLYNTPSLSSRLLLPLTQLRENFFSILLSHDAVPRDPLDQIFKK
jgi:hypothetical protein